MRLSGWIQPTHAILCLVGAGATAGLVHAALVLKGPNGHGNRAFDGIAAHAPINRFVPLAQVTDSSGPIPFDDPAMLASVCRFDLANAPVRFTIQPFARGFAAIGFHAKSGSPFYGLTIDSDEASAITVSLMTAVQQGDATSEEEGAPASHDLQIVSPDREGFILVQAPRGDAGAVAAAQETLARMSCSSAPLEPTKPAGQD